jgi:hypothetical protein
MTSRITNASSFHPGAKIKKPIKTIKSTHTKPKIETNIVKIGEYTFTKDGVFAIKPIKPIIPGYITSAELQTTSNFLYIRSDYVTSKSIDMNTALGKLFTNGFIVATGKTPTLVFKRGGLDMPSLYTEYKFYRPLKDERVYVNDIPTDDDISINENDCLKFGECLTVASQTGDKSRFNNMVQANTNPSVLQSSTTDKQFGETDKTNIKIAKETVPGKKNNFAVPQNGQSYAIIRTKLIDNSAPYHIAFVVYTHASVNITLEAEADNGNDYQPKFCFYDTEPSGHTFHRRWSAELYKDAIDENGINRYNMLYNNGETIVLASRKIGDVLKEIKREEDAVTISMPLKKKRKTGGNRIKRNSKGYKNRTRKISKNRYRK